MHVWNVPHVAHWKYRMQKLRKKWPSAHHYTTLSGYISTTKACIDNWKKVVKQQYLPHMSSQYGERPCNSWDWLASLGHPSKFQRASCLGFITAPMSFNRGQPNSARCLPSVGLVHHIYMFWGLLPVTNSARCKIHFVSLAFSSLAALLHGTRAVGISQTLWHGTRNRITELSLLAIFNRGRHLYSEGSHHVGHRPTFQFRLINHTYTCKSKLQLQTSSPNCVKLGTHPWYIHYSSDQCPFLPNHQ